MVVGGSPLVIPPDFALRPPQPGVPRPQEQASSSQAEALTLGETGAAPTAPSDLEQQVLATAGADKSSKDIRKLVDGRIRREYWGQPSSRR